MIEKSQAGMPVPEDVTVRADGNTIDNNNFGLPKNKTSCHTKRCPRCDRLIDAGSWDVHVHFCEGKPQIRPRKTSVQESCKTCPSVYECKRIWKDCGKRYRSPELTREIVGMAGKRGDRMACLKRCGE